jgi:GTPase SAR1 family protein
VRGRFRLRLQKSFSVISNVKNRFPKIMESYYASSHAVMVTFDVQNAQSFFVAQQRCRHMQKRSRSTPTEKPFLILVGTKIDLEKTRSVSSTQAEYAAERVGAIYVETSAKTGVGVEQAFCVSGSRALRKMYFDAHVPQDEVESPPDLVAGAGESPAVVEPSHFKSFMSYTFEYFLRRFSSS